jgi:hypothetical protein
MRSSSPKSAYFVLSFVFTLAGLSACGDDSTTPSPGTGGSVTPAEGGSDATAEAEGAAGSVEAGGEAAPEAAPSSDAPAEASDATATDVAVEASDAPTSDAVSDRLLDVPVIPIDVTLDVPALLEAGD